MDMKRDLDIRQPPDDGNEVWHRDAGWKPDKRWRQREIKKLKGTVNRDALTALLAFIPILEQMNKTDEVFGVEGEDGDEVEPGVFRFSCMQAKPIVWEVTNQFQDANMAVQFDWPKWHEGRGLMKEGCPLPDDFLTLCMLYSAIIRNNRFCEGALVCAFRHGDILRILKGLARTQEQIA